MRSAAGLALLLAGVARAAMELPPDTLEYVGCYQDDASARQFMPAPENRPRFVGGCAVSCKSYTYYAIQDSNPGVDPQNAPNPYCYCGDSLGSFTKLDDATSCIGGCVAGGDRNKERRCGQELQNAVYRRIPATIHVPTKLPPNAVEYVGCYRDVIVNGGGSQFEFNVGRNPISPGVGNGIFLTHCSTHCKDYSYFAVQDSTSNANGDGRKSNCYCGNTPDLTGRNQFEKLPDSACPSSTCFANGDRHWDRPCGTRGINAVYRQVPAPTVAGDPFTTYNGKKMQFYMPVAEEIKLLTCGSWELAGRVMASNIPGDTQQWFDLFRVSAGGQEALLVQTADVSALLPSAAAAGGGAAGGGDDADDVAVLAAAGRVRLALDQQRRARSVLPAGAKRSLTTLRVAADGAALPSTGSLIAAGAVNVTVTQDVARPIGLGYVETVDIVTDGVGMQITSSAASKFHSEVDRIKKLHMDIAFTHINATTCTGVLPEVWGVRPMSRRTARFLSPQQ